MAKKKPTAARKKKAPRKGTQEFLTGLGPQRNERVYAAAKIYRKLMGERVAASNKETDAHATLLSIMLEEGLTAYNDGDINLVISAGKQKVKILEVSEDEESEPGEES